MMVGQSAHKLYVVHHNERHVGTVEVIGALLGIETRPFLTAEGALEKAENDPPLILFTDLLLPGMDGLSLSTHLSRKNVTTVLLSAIPPALSPSAPKRIGLKKIILTRGDWPVHVHRILLDTLKRKGGLPELSSSARGLLQAIEQGQKGFGTIASWLQSETLLGESQALALKYLANVFDHDNVLSVLERVILKDSTAAQAAVGDNAPVTPTHVELHETALALAMDLPGAGFEIIEEIAESPASPADLRGRAMRHLASEYPHDAVMPTFEAAMNDPAPLVRLDGAFAAFESTLRLGEAGLETMRVLAETDGIAEEVRIKALRHLVNEFPRAAAEPTRRKLSTSGLSRLREEANALARASQHNLQQIATVAMNEQAPVSDRLGSLKRLLTSPKQNVLPIFERCQTSSSEQVAQLAFELALRRADTGFEGSIKRAIEGGEQMQRAALLGAMQLGTAGFGAVKRLAESPNAGAEVRSMALRFLGLRFQPGVVLPVLERAIKDLDLVIGQATLLSAIQLGPPGLSLLKRALVEADRPEIRELAIRHLDHYAESTAFRQALKKAINDPDEGVKSAAIEIAVRRAGSEFPPLLRRVIEMNIEPLQHAALDGIIALGEGGYGPAKALAVTSAVARDVRVRALRHLLTFPEEDTALIAKQVGAQRPDELSEAKRTPEEQEAFEREQSKQAALERQRRQAELERQEAERRRKEEELRKRKEEEERKKAAAAAAKAAREKAAQERSKPKVEVDDLEPPTVASAPATIVPEEPTQPHKPATEADQTLLDPPRLFPEQPGAGARANQESWEVAVTRPTKPAIEPAPPKQRPLSERIPPTREKPVTPKRKKLAVNKPRPKPRPDQMDMAKARRALETAISMGRDGYRGIRTLAESKRVPTDVRVQALRHLASDFPDRQVAEVLEMAMKARSTKLRNVALGCAMLRKDTQFEAIRALAESSDEVPLKEEFEHRRVRVRAMKFLARHWSKAEATPVLDRLLEDPAPEIQRASLESLFTSLRFIQRGAVEQALVNLLREHESLTAKISAAKALGSFGSSYSIRALEDFTGLFSDSEVKTAAKRAIERIKARAD